MILTNCAACAAPLDHSAPRCIRCQTRYCGATCQHDHWRRGHKQICKKIHRGGGAEQYHADKKYKEAVAVAVEACADDTRGQKCYIFLEAVHARTGEGLVRGCGCGDRDGVSSPELGVAHVSCLAEQAKILVAEAEDNDLGGKAAWIERWTRWHTCSLCEQKFHGVVLCALAWACWKTYSGRPERAGVRCMAMNLLGNGLSAAKHHADVLTVQEAELSMHRRIGASEETLLVVQGNLAVTYKQLGRFDEAHGMQRDVYYGHLKLDGEEAAQTLITAHNYAASLSDLKRFEETKSLMRKTIPVAQRVLGESDVTTINLRWNYASALCEAAGATRDDLREAVTTFTEIERTARRVLGNSHPDVLAIGKDLRNSRNDLARLGEDSDKAALAALAFVAAVAFLVGRRYLRR